MWVKSIEKSNAMYTNARDEMYTNINNKVSGAASRLPRCGTIRNYHLKSGFQYFSKKREDHEE
jgi:hypothetical protein